MIKKEHVKHLKDMNAEAEKLVESQKILNPYYDRMFLTVYSIIEMVNIYNLTLNCAVCFVEVVLDAYRPRVPEALCHHSTGAGAAQ